MGTPYAQVYEHFLSKISDYSFLQIPEEELENILEVYLKTAMSEFDSSTRDFNLRDDEAKEFEEILSLKEIDILANLMVVAYLKPKVITTENIKLGMSDADYRIYSQANHIKELMTLYKEMKSEVQKMITKFSYKNADWDKLQ